MRFVVKLGVIASDNFLKLTVSLLLEQLDKSWPFNSTHYFVLCPQNGDRIVATVSVTSLHPVYRT